MCIFILKLPLPEEQTSETWEPSGSIEKKVPLNFFLSSKGKNVFGKSRILNVESRTKKNNGFKMTGTAAVVIKF
jgi:hypothetical protein